MKKIIAIELNTDDGGYIEVAGELLQCKDCANWNANGDTHRCFVWCVYTPHDGFCHRADRKEG